MRISHEPLKNDWLAKTATTGSEKMITEKEYISGSWDA